MLLADVAAVSRAVARTRSRRAKIDLLAGLLRRVPPSEVAIAVSYLSGELPQGAIGVGWASLSQRPPPAGERSLALAEVDATLSGLAGLSGRGSQDARRTLLRELLGRATGDEQEFLTALLLGELRQGALRGVMTEAVAAACGHPASEVRRAVMLAGDLATVAAAALGGAGLQGFSLRPGEPVQPMLAHGATTLEDALARTGDAVAEYKLDGARLQVHRDGDRVWAFTRNLADVTGRVPEIVEAVAALPLDSVVLDGEAIALGPGGRPLAFQETMSRFGSRLDVARARERTPLSFFAFDVLHLDGADLLDRPQHERSAALAGSLPPELVMPCAIGDAGALRGFFDAAIAAGHEGVVVKSLDAPYEAGRRGAAWVKVKRVHTLDLVVLAAEWGHGRRRGMLSNLHLGARGPDGFVMLGKTFKGLTDDLLRWQTERLLELATGRAGHVVHVRPELVVEVAFDGLQTSPRYPGGLALRFARVKRYRPDKDASEADTIERVRALVAPRP